MGAGRWLTPRVPASIGDAENGLSVALRGGRRAGARLRDARGGGRECAAGRDLFSGVASPGPALTLSGSPRPRCARRPRRESPRRFAALDEAVGGSAGYGEYDPFIVREYRRIPAIS